MNFEIVPITDELIEGFCKAVSAVAQERLYLLSLEGFTLESSHIFVHENREKGMPHFVALDKGKVVGWCDIRSKGFPVLEHSGELGIGVIKSHRGQGIGKKLMEATLAAAKEKGLTRVELTVRENNTNAIALYKKVGFEVEGVLRNAIYVDGVYINHIAMAILFD
jgi:ribosomal protein S18 acetylase RimI-like enzyme